MLKKLLTYEFRSTARIFGLCYAGTLAAALLLRIMMFLSWDHTWEYSAQMEQLFPMRDMAASLSSMLYGVMIAAVIVLTCVMILLRFYKNLLGGEGYLMHTLPVRSWELIVSKLIAAVVWTLLSTVVIFLSILVLAADPNPTFWSSFFRDMVQLFAYFRAEFHFPLSILILEFLLVILVGIISSTLQVYAAIMLGHQAQKHRIALAVGAYFGISMALNMILTILLNILFVFSRTMPHSLRDAIGGFLEGLTPVQAYHLGMFVLFAANLIVAVAFFFLTERLMRRNLNLE